MGGNARGLRHSFQLYLVIYNVTCNAEPIYSKTQKKKKTRQISDLIDIS